MIQPQRVVAKALALYVLVLPLLGSPAAAKGGGNGRGSGGDGELRNRGGSEFRARGLASRLDGFNGFKAETLPGAFHHHGHAHVGGLAKFESPWGELMTIRYWSSPSGTVSIEYDGELTVRYQFDDLGVLEALTAETGERRAHTVIGMRSEQVLLGEAELESFDMSAYQLIDDVFRGKHSADFLDGIARFEAPASASCATASIQCAACIVIWAVTVTAISTACLVGGVPTWGIACLGAILVHEATSFSCAATCINAHEQCGFDRPSKGDPVDDGCSGPGDAV